MRYLRFAPLPIVAFVLVLSSATPAHALDLGYYWTEVRTWFAAGGGSMWFILACSVLAIAFTIERLVRLQRKRLVPRGLVVQCRTLWSEGRHQEISDLCGQDNSMLARIIRLLIKHRAAPLGDLRTMIADAASSELRLHFRRIHPIAVAATVAPLLGLFGTVDGMISAFNHFRLLGETGDPTVFAGDISLALITTQFGLMVAIPSLALWHWFRNRTNSFADELETTVQELYLDWFLESQGAPQAVMAQPVRADGAR